MVVLILPTISEPLRAQITLSYMISLPCTCKGITSNELKVCLCYRLNHPIIDLFLTSIPLLRILASGLQNTSYGLTLVLYQPK